MINGALIWGVGFISLYECGADSSRARSCAAACVAKSCNQARHALEHGTRLGWFAGLEAKDHGSYSSLMSAEPAMHL